MLHGMAYNRRASRRGLNYEAVLVGGLVAVCLLIFGHLWHRNSMFNCKHNFERRILEATGEGTPEERMQTLFLKMEAMKEELQTIKSEKEAQWAVYEDKIKGKEKQISRLQDVERYSRKMKSRIEVRANIALLNLTGGKMAAIDEMLDKQAEQDLIIKARLKEERALKKLKKGKLKNLEQQVIDAENVEGFNDEDETTKSLMRKLHSTVQEMRTNGTKVPREAIEMLLPALIDDGTFQNFDEMLKEESKDPMELDWQEYGAVIQRERSRGLAWLRWLRNYWKLWLEDTTDMIDDNLKAQIFRQIPGQHVSLVQAGKLVNIFRGVVPKYKRCAVVGNSQRMLLSERGEDIDQYDAVLRLNQAPTEGFERWVGSKTTYRMINNFWANTYHRQGEKRLPSDDTLKKRLALETNVTLLVSRTDAYKYMNLVKLIERLRPDVGITMLAREGVDAVGRYLRGLKLRIEAERAMEYPGKASPSSGFLGIILMRQMCEQVHVYGVAQTGETTSWHYWEERNFHASREFGMDPHHSFDLERDVIQLRSPAPSEEKTYQEIQEFVPKLLKEIRQEIGEKVGKAIEAKKAEEEAAKLLGEQHDGEEKPTQSMAVSEALTATSNHLKQIESHTESQFTGQIMDMPSEAYLIDDSVTSGSPLGERLRA